MRGLLFVLLLLPALAVGETSSGFESARQEARYWELTQQLRCLVCQGQSVSDSDADLANDLKREVKRMILEGKTDAEIVDFMVARYGDFVLFKPPVRASTYLLWFGPFALLAIGGGVWLVLLRRRARTEEGSLTDAERARLAQVLRESQRRGDT